MVIEATASNERIKTLTDALHDLQASYDLLSANYTSYR